MKHKHMFNYDDRGDAGWVTLFAYFADEAAARAAVDDIQCVCGTRLEREEHFVYALLYDHEVGAAKQELAEAGYGLCHIDTPNVRFTVEV